MHPLTGHVAHHIETGWSTVNTDAIRATCLTCGDHAEAWCTSTDYVAIRHAEQVARGYLAETCCVEQHRHQDATPC